MKFYTCNFNHMILGVMLGLTIQGCGRNDAVPGIISQGNKSKQTASTTQSSNSIPVTGETKTAVTCPFESATKFKLNSTSRLMWISQKGAGIPVVGQHNVTGELVVTGGVLKEVKFKVDMDGFDTGNKVRDDRLRKWFFQTDTTKEMELNAKVEPPAAASLAAAVAGVSVDPDVKIPGDGETIRATLNGSIVLARQSIKFTIPALVSRTNGMLMVLQENPSAVINIASQLKFGEKLAKLVSLANVAISDKVEVRSQFALDPSCQ